MLMAKNEEFQQSEFALVIFWGTQSSRFCCNMVTQVQTPPQQWEDEGLTVFTKALLDTLNEKLDYKKRFQIRNNRADVEMI